MNLLETVWHFWNRSFEIKMFPRRALTKTYHRCYKVHCAVCGDTGTNLSFIARHHSVKSRDGTTMLYASHQNRKYLCPGCARDVEKFEAVTVKDRESITNPAYFSKMLEGCQVYNACDVLTAHHELLKDDPERLSTDFMIKMVSGSYKANQYRATMAGA